MPAYPQYVGLNQVNKVELMKTIFISVLIGTGEHASHQGMSLAGTRHACDEDMSPQSQGMLHPQTGNLHFQRKR